MAEHILGVDTIREAGLAQLYGADNGGGRIAASAIGEAEIRVVMRFTKDVSHRQWAQIML